MTNTSVKEKKQKVIEQAGFRKYFEADDWKDFNRKFFDGLAPKYDRLNHVLSCGQHDRFKAQAMEKFDAKPDGFFLDLCTGSGDMAIALARKYPEASILALDASSVMLDIAKLKTSQRGIVTVDYRQADVTRLHLPDDSVDLVMISFGLRNLEDIPAALREFHRVLRPGGQLVNLDLGKPRGAVLKGLYRLWFEVIIPFLGRTIFHRGEFNSFLYLPISNRYFPSQQELMRIMEDIGFTDVNNYNYMLGGVAQQVARK